MYFSRHYLIAILSAALALVSLAIGIRLYATEGAVRNFFQSYVYIRPSLHIDGSFFSRQPSPSPSPQQPAITAKSYLVGNVATGKIYLKSDSAESLPVASMSKLVTAIAASDTLDLNSTTQITDGEISLPPDASNLMAGETLTLRDLLLPMLLSSSNIAAEAIASSVNRQKFMDAMTGYAWEIGMPSSFFADPSGIDPRNEASAEDIFALARYLYSYRPDILATTRIAKMSFATTSSHGSHEIVSTHPFVSDPRFIGGKTGRTPEAGETMLTLLNINNQPVAFVVLGSALGTREWDTRALIDRYLNLK